MSRTGAIAASGGATGATGAAYYFDARDAVNDGAGKVSSIACRITGASATPNIAGNRPTRNTSFVSGKITVQNTAQTNNLVATISGTWNAKTDTTYVIRCNVTSLNAIMFMGSIYPTIDTSSSGQRWLFHSADSNQRYYRGATVGGGTTTAVAGGAALDTNAWRTYGWVYTGGTDTVTYWENGSTYDSDAIVLSMNHNPNRIALGCHVNFTNAFVGHWGAIRLFNRALSAGEMASEHSYLSGIWA